MVGIDHVFGHVKTPCGEFDHCIQFVSPVAVIAKPLEADHKERGKGPQVKLLCCLLMFLAVRTVPESINSNIYNGAGRRLLFFL